LHTRHIGSRVTDILHDRMEAGTLWAERATSPWYQLFYLLPSYHGVIRSTSPSRLDWS